MNIDKFKKLFKSQIYFKIPTKKTILIFDKNGSENFTKIIPKNSYYILCIRGERLNIFVFLKMILKFKFSHRSYIEEYIKTIKPKIIITYIDNNISFYKFKFNKTIKIAIQNARRTFLPDDIFYNLKKDKDLNCDYIFVHNYPIINFYKKFIKSNYIVSGSFKSNEITINENTKKFDLVYVSTFRKLQNYYIYKKHDWFSWQEKEIKLLKFAEKYCKKNNKILTIIGAETETNEELKFYKKNLEFRFNFIKKYKNRNVYKIIDQSKVVFGIDSTLLSECIARNAKVGFFSLRGNFFPYNSRKFGWPYNYPLKGNFWDYRERYLHFERVINYLYKVKKSTWKKVCKNHKKNIMVYSYKNHVLKNILLKNLKKNNF